MELQRQFDLTMWLHLLVFFPDLNPDGELHWSAGLLSPTQPFLGGALLSDPPWSWLSW